MQSMGGWAFQKWPWKGMGLQKNRRFDERRLRGFIV